MASRLSHHLLCIHSPYTNSSSNSPKLVTIPNCAVRVRAVRRTSHQQNPSTSLETSTQELKHPILSKRGDGSDSNSSSVSTLFGSFSVLIRRLRDGFGADELGLEILSIALPAALALAADPIASLVDTAFVGHLGSVELAAVGVSVSVFNLVSKLFNVPLLNITTSFVAEEQALASTSENESIRIGQDHVNGHKRKMLLPSVSTSLALAAGIGIVEAVALSVGSGFLMNIMGIPVDSPMRVPAEQFLTLRAFGAPPIVIALAAQGTFRGFKDTKTPLYAVGAGNLLNAMLDPILIFLLGLGIGGAAISTVISEYLIAFVLLWELNDKVLLISPIIDGMRIAQYLKSGGLLIGRTLAVLATMTLATSMAAREGPIPMAGHQICLQVWLAISLLTDALALSGQMVPLLLVMVLAYMWYVLFAVHPGLSIVEALLAGGYSQGNYEEAQQVIYKVLEMGLATGIALAVILFLGFGAFASLFTTDSEVLEVAWSGILFVAGSQPMNAIAFVIDGLYYGVSDFGYAAYSMVLVALISSVFLLLAAPVCGLAGVWTGLFLFMTLRVVAGIWRLSTKSGPWKMIWSKSEVEQESD